MECVVIADYGKDSEERTKDDLNIWVFEHRNSDSIVVSWQKEYPNNGMFNEETYRERRKGFGYDDHGAADFIVNLVKEQFKHEFKDK